MLEAAAEALAFVQGKARDDLEKDRLLLMGICRCLEIVGEAAAKVSRPTRQAMSGLPWLDMIGMRNRLIHAYFDVDLGQIWDTVALDLPDLVAALRLALKEG
ncbi:MAG: HepT-like ribonuclease domain-containing protein [Pseudomonadota bacterium]